MKSFWTQTRPNGKPVDAGTFAYVIDLEDGTNPQYTYGKTTEEVLAKIAHTTAHAQAALAARRSVLATTPASTTPVTVLKPRMTADEVQRATADLENPGKAGQAIVSLVEDATGLDINRMVLKNFGDMAQEWEEANPEFYAHSGNKRLLVDQAKAYVGGELGRVTDEHLTRAFESLTARGMLFQEPSTTFTPPTPSTLPGESPVQQERPRRLSTGVRSMSLRSSTPAPRPTIKYSAEEIRRMPLAQSRRLLEANDKDYIESSEFHFGAQQVTA